MNESIQLSLLFAFVIGLAIGILFFGGLLWTLKLEALKLRPKLWYLSSFITRMTLAMVGFYLLLKQGLIYLMVSLIGFSIMRFVITKQAKNMEHDYASKP